MKRSLKKRKHSKKKIVIMMTISLFLIFFTNNILNGVYECTDYLLNTIRARTIYIDMNLEAYDEVGEELVSYIENSPEVLGYSYAQDWALQIDGLEDEFGIYRLCPYLSQVVEPYMITKLDQLKDNEIIIQKYITKDQYGSPEKTMEYIDGEEYIGKYVTFTVNKYNWLTREKLETREYTLKVAGVFDNVAGGENLVGYVSNNLANEIMNYAVWYDEDYKKTQEFRQYETTVFLQVVADHSSNVNRTIGNLENICKESGDMYSYLIQTRSGMSENAFVTLEGIKFISNFLAIYLILCSIINIFLCVKETMENRKREFGILKAIGYRDARICLGLAPQALIEIFVPLGIVYITGGIAFSFVNSYIEKNFSVFWNMIRFQMIDYVNVIVISMAVIIPLAGYIYSMIKVSKMEAMEALK